MAVLTVPPNRPDTEARKRRDASLQSQDEAIAEHLAQALALRLEGMRVSGRV